MSSDSTFGYPEGKVAGAFDQASAAQAREALLAAGFTSDQVESITAADVEGIEPPFHEGGFKGLVDRFLLTVGDHHRQLQQVREELEAGLTIVAVSVEDDEAKRRAGEILLDHGSRHTRFFGRWAVETLAGPA